MRAICIGLFIDGFDFFQKTVLFDFLVVEEVLEEMLIIQLQERSKVELIWVVHFFMVVINVQTLIEESLILEMHREKLILFLQKVDYLIVIRLIVLGMLVKLRNEVVESLLRVIDLIDLHYSFFGLVDHVV